MPDTSVDELARLARDERDAKACRKYMAAYHRKKGLSFKEIGALAFATHIAVRYWLMAMHKGGPKRRPAAQEPRQATKDPPRHPPQDARRHTQGPAGVRLQGQRADVQGDPPAPQGKVRPGRGVLDDRKDPERDGRRARGAPPGAPKGGEPLGAAGLQGRAKRPRPPPRTGPASPSPARAAYSCRAAGLKGVEKGRCRARARAPAARAWEPSRPPAAGRFAMASETAPAAGCRLSLSVRPRVGLVRLAETAPAAGCRFPGRLCELAGSIHATGGSA